MTAALTTTRVAEPRGSVNRLMRRLGAALAALGERIAGWSAAYYESGISDGFAGAQPSERIDAALRWHARQRRIV